MWMRGTSREQELDKCALVMARGAFVVVLTSDDFSDSPTPAPGAPLNCDVAWVFFIGARKAADNHAASLRASPILQQPEQEETRHGTD